MNIKIIIDLIYLKAIKAVYFLILPAALLLNLLAEAWISSLEISMRPYYLFWGNLRVLSGMVLFCANIFLIYDYVIVKFGWLKTGHGKRRAPYLTRFIPGRFGHFIALLWSVMLIHFSLSGSAFFFYGLNMGESILHGAILNIKISHELVLWFFIAVTLIYYYFVCGSFVRKIVRVSSG